MNDSVTAPIEVHRKGRFPARGVSLFSLDMGLLCPYPIQESGLVAIQRIWPSLANLSYWEASQNGRHIH